MSSLFDDAPIVYDTPLLHLSTENSSIFCIPGHDHDARKHALLASWVRRVLQYVVLTDMQLEDRINYGYLNGEESVVDDVSLMKVTIDPDPLNENSEPCTWLEF